METHFWRKHTLLQAVQLRFEQKSFHRFQIETIDTLRRYYRPSQLQGFFHNLKYSRKLVQLFFNLDKRKSLNANKQAKVRPT